MGALANTAPSREAKARPSPAAALAKSHGDAYELARAHHGGRQIGALCVEIHRSDGEIGVKRILGVLSDLDETRDTKVIYVARCRQ